MIPIHKKMESDSSTHCMDSSTVQKAFDKVWVDALLLKLKKCSIHGNMFRWIKSYLHNRRARVVIDNTKSKKEFLRHGVLQREILSPSLF